MGRGWLSVGFVAVALLGCNNEHDAEPTPQALAKCEAYVAALCDRQVTCFEWTAEAGAQCRTMGAAAAGCTTAVATAEGYDACLADVAARPCAEAATPPSSCDKVIVHTP